MWTNLVRLNTIYVSTPPTRMFNANLHRHMQSPIKGKCSRLLATAHKRSTHHRRPRKDCLLAISNRGESTWNLTQIQWKWNIKALLFLKNESYDISLPKDQPYLRTEGNSPSYPRREASPYMNPVSSITWPHWNVRNHPDPECLLCVCSGYRHRDALWGPQLLPLHAHLR